MKVIRPSNITTNKILSNNAVDSFPTWNEATTYSTGQKVTYNNYYWESLGSGNLNKNPEQETLFWGKIGPSNKWAMFDLQVSSQTVVNGNLLFTIKPEESINALTFFNLKGSSVKVRVLNAPSGNEVYNRTTKLDGTFISDWYTYFFEEYSFREEIVFKDIPPYKNCVVEITVYGTETRLGAFVIGSMIKIGMTQEGLSYGIRDYSVKETDEFGVTTFVKRNFSKRMQPVVFVDNHRLNYVGKVLTGLRSTPTAWVATDDQRFEGTVVFGFCKDWNVEVPYPNNSLISIDVEGLI